MMASVAVTAFIPTYSANADQSKDDGAFATSNTIHMGDGSTDVNEADTGLGHIRRQRFLRWRAHRR